MSQMLWGHNDGNCLQGAEKLAVRTRVFPHVACHRTTPLFLNTWYW